MSAPRKSLKDRFLAAPKEEPQVKIPDPDPSTALAAAAKEGIMSIERLHADNQKKTRDLETAHRRLDYIVHENIKLREEADYYHAKCDTFMQNDAGVHAFMIQMRDLANHVCNMMQHRTQIVARMPTPPKVTNNPVLTPIEDEPEAPQFAPDGIPYNAAVSNQQIKEMISNLEERA